MSSSTILEEELDEKQLAAPRPDLVRTQSNLEKAIDAEANVHPQSEPGDESISDRDSNDPGPPPNGGFRAWLQVIGSFFLFFNCWYSTTYRRCFKVFIS
jgi:hypothetical protein